MDNKIASLEARFYSKISHSNANGCWIWIGSKANFGYGQIWFDGRVVVASRIALLLATGEAVPEDKLACHHCDNPECVNPRHLFIGTRKDNQQDCLSKGRFFGPNLTHCKNGHEFSLSNTKKRNKIGISRRCVECQKKYGRDYMRRKRAALKAMEGAQ